MSSFSFFETIYVKSFSDDEMKEYYNNCKSSDLDLSEEEKKSLVAITGGHPYWSDFILGKYKDAKDKDKETDLETIFHQNIGAMHEKYKEMLDLLNEQDLLKKLYQIIFGPMDPTCTKGDVQTLCNYGILDNEENPKLISDKLHEYMKMQERNFNFYTLWNETERGLRRILKLKLDEKYKPDDWQEKILDRYLLKPEELMEALKQHFEKDHRPIEWSGTIYKKKDYLLSVDLKEADGHKSQWKEDQARGRLNEDACITLLEGIYTKSLFFLCEFEYEELKMKEIFGDLYEFLKKAKHLVKARNTYQHNNDELLREDYKKKTNEYCQELCDKIKEYFDKINAYEKKKF